MTTTRKPKLSTKPETVRLQCDRCGTIRDARLTPRISAYDGEFMLVIRPACTCGARRGTVIR